MSEAHKPCHGSASGVVPSQSEGHHFPYSLHWKLEEIAALLNVKVGRIGQREQIVAMFLDSFDTLPPRISVNDYWGNEIWGIETDSVIKKSPISRRKSRQICEESPHPPVNPFAGVTLLKAPDNECGLSPQQRMNEVSGILATIALRVAKKQSGQHQISPTDSLEH